MYGSFSFQYGSADEKTHLEIVLFGKIDRIDTSLKENPYESGTGYRTLSA